MRYESERGGLRGIGRQEGEYKSCFSGVRARAMYNMTHRGD